MFGRYSEVDVQCRRQRLRRPVKQGPAEEHFLYFDLYSPIQQIFSGATYRWQLNVRRYPLQRIVSIEASACCCAASLLPAQSARYIRGQITDETGAVVPTARVTVTAVSSGNVKTVTAGADGSYVVLALFRA